MSEFFPNYLNIVSAARNQRAERLPLYEHIISDAMMERVLGREMAPLVEGDRADRREYIRRMIRFFLKMGYDTVSFERLISAAMPDSGALYYHRPDAIKDWADFRRYPWDEVAVNFRKNIEFFELLAEEMPPGMKAVGGPGNGIFECVQDVVGYEALCYISADEPELFEALFQKVGDVIYGIWEEFYARFHDLFAICRIGDDLGFRSATLLDPGDIRQLIIPQYRRLTDMAHRMGKPFLLHSCGCIFPLMDDLIEHGGIDAKHSNEDAIAPFQKWVDDYGARIGNFGGVDMNVLCQSAPEEISRYVLHVLEGADGHGGFAAGSGNSIPAYVPLEGYLAMVDTVRKYRGGN